MNTAGDAADQVMRESIQITEASIRLAGMGAKNLAALLLALAHDQQKMKGKTSLQRLLKDGRELKVCRLKTKDLAQFHQEAKRYGVLYTPIIDKKSNDGICDLMIRAEDVSKINHILDRMGYLIQADPSDKKAIDEKKNPVLENSLSKQAHTSEPNLSTTTKATERPSVKSRLQAAKTAAMSEQVKPSKELTR